MNTSTAIAEDNSDDTSTSNISGNNASTGNTLPSPTSTSNRPKSSASPASGQLDADNSTGTIRERIREDIQSHVQNTKNNQDVRNKILPVTSRNQLSTSSPASTSPIMKQIQKERQLGDKRKETRMEVFREEQKMVVHNLQNILNNLEQVRTRVESRISKAESSGRDMTEAKQLLSGIDTKINNAQTAIDKISEYVTLNLSTTTASTTVKLSKPRELVNATNKAIKEVKETLNKTIVAIAHAMGLKLGNDESSTTPPIHKATPPPKPPSKPSTTTPETTGTSTDSVE